MSLWASVLWIFQKKCNRLVGDSLDQKTKERKQGYISKTDRALRKMKVGRKSDSVTKDKRDREVRTVTKK